MTTTDTLAISVRQRPSKPNMSRERWSKIWPPLLVTVVGIIAWEAVIRFFDISEFIIATPSAIFLAFVKYQELLFEASWVTLQEILYGFLISIIIGVGLALLIVRYNWLDRALYPLVVLFQVVPKVALAPIFILWFGYGLTPKLVLIVVIAFFPITLNMIVGLKSYDRDLSVLLKSIGGTNDQFLWKIQFPTSLPYLFAGLRIGITLSVIGAVVAEFSGASSGLGYLIQFASTQLNTPLMFAALILISLMGLVLYYSISWLESLVNKWYPHIKLQNVN